jgi:hypothetical protein
MEKNSFFFESNDFQSLKNNIKPKKNCDDRRHLFMTYHSDIIQALT